MIDLLLLLLYPALLWDSDRRKYWYLLPVALVATFADIVACHTTWRLIAGKPRRNEWTISQTLERLCIDHGPDQFLYVQIARKINRIDPRGCHIKAAV